MQEIWKDIQGYEGYYQVSNLGRVKSLRSNTILKINDIKGGYSQVGLSINGKQKTKRIHRLVATAFLDNEFNLTQINHKDKNRHNNRVDNLEWCDYKYNIQYSRARKVNQYDMQGNFIKTWNCVSDIERELGIKNQMIIRCCKSMRNKTHNYIWRYADE